MMEMPKNGFVAYEYKEIPAGKEQTPFLLDCYESLGWEMDQRIDTGKSITLRRNRKLINHMELTRLQHHLEACLKNIETLEASKSAKATTGALITGILGTAFVTGSVFCVVASPPIIWLCILLAVPGFALWAYAPLLHKRLVAQRTKTADELIENKYNEIYEICEKGSKLL